MSDSSVNVYIPTCGTYSTKNKKIERKPYLLLQSKRSL